MESGQLVGNALQSQLILRGTKVQPDCMGRTSFAEHMGSPLGLKCFFGSLSEGIIGLRTGGYGMAYKLQR
jgi:hypothetical protein